MYISTQKIDKEKLLEGIEKSIKRALGEYLIYNDKSWAYFYYGRARAIQDLYIDLYGDNIGINLENLLILFEKVIDADSLNIFEKDGEENEQD